jgi:hypothetical protein
MLVLSPRPLSLAQPCMKLTDKVLLLIFGFHLLVFNAIGKADVLIDDVKSADFYSLELPVEALNIDSLDTVFFNLAAATCNGSVMSVPVSIYSDDLVYSIDFALKLNQPEIEYNSILSSNGNLFYSANFNVADSTLRFTSFSIVEIDTGINLFSVQFNIGPEYIDMTDFPVYSALLNGDNCSFKIKNTPAEPVIDPVGSINLVAGDSLELNVISSPGTSILWFNGETDSVVYVDTAGLYSVTLVNPGGCATILSLEVFLATPLPVEFTSVDAVLNGDRVDVRWTTASESNNDYFFVERSSDLLEWKRLGEVPGAGFSNQLLSYSFLDFPVFDGLMYYRVGQVDFDGTCSYSKVCAVLLKNPGVTSISELMVYPNPSVGGGITLNIFPVDILSVDLSLFNMSGGLLYSFSSTDLIKGSSGLFVSLPNWLSPGMYNLILEDGKMTNSASIIIH